MSTQRGFVIPIGGAEKKIRQATILRRFVELCGGASARIAVIPTASKLDGTGETYDHAFATIGAGHIDILHIKERADAMSAEAVATLGAATGIFMTGGDQLRLSTILGGTELANAIRQANAAGVHVAGTSAGAAFISEHMICYGRGGPTPRMGMTTLAQGLGLTRLGPMSGGLACRSVERSPDGLFPQPPPRITLLFPGVSFTGFSEDDRR